MIKKHNKIILGFTFLSSIFFSNNIFASSPTANSSLSNLYGPTGRVLEEGEKPVHDAICQSYGYKNVMQTKCFDAEPVSSKPDTPKTAKNIDLQDTVKEATSGDHRTVYTYRDKSGILHYTENVPEEYKKISTIYKKGTITGNTESMISYPKNLAGPAVAAENPSVGKDYFTPTSISTSINNMERNTHISKTTAITKSSVKNNSKNSKINNRNNKTSVNSQISKAKKVTAKPLKTTKATEKSMTTKISSKSKTIIKSKTQKK